MSVRSLKKRFLDIIESNAEVDPYELRRIFTEAIREWEIQQGWEERQKRKPWSDDELRVVLADAPTKENCLRHARAFGRGYGAIEQIYRWAATPDPVIKSKRPGDAFIAQIKKVAKQLGWRA